MDIDGWNEIIDIVDRNINIRNKLLEESPIEEYRTRMVKFALIIQSQVQTQHRDSRSFRYILHRYKKKNGKYCYLNTTSTLIR